MNEPISYEQKVKVINSIAREMDDRMKIPVTRLKVCAYIRVSTNYMEQEESYESQKAYYEQYIKSNPSYEFVGVYGDEGITGTQIKNRDDFQRMITDAINGKIDLIICKSISRFLRNTEQTLRYVRLLREKNVTIWFEKENIRTDDTSGELLLTIMSSMAQQESVSHSGNVKIGLKNKMERGIMVGKQRCLGYDVDKENNTLVIIPEEAEIVRFIYERYLEGYGSKVVARMLQERGYKNRSGNTTWSEGTVKQIVKNVKYKGSLLQGQTMTVDVLTHRRIKNMGERPMYYIEDHHPPIVTKEAWEAANKMLNERAQKNPNYNTRAKISGHLALSDKVECGACGGNATRRKWHSGKNSEKAAWMCSIYIRKGKKYCPDVKGIPEQLIKDAFVDAFNGLCINNEAIISEFLKRTEKVLKNQNDEKELEMVYTDINKMKKKIDALIEMRLEGNIDKETYNNKYGLLKLQLDELQQKQYELENVVESLEDTQTRIRKFQKYFQENQPLKEFDNVVFRYSINKVILGGRDENGWNPYLLTFIFNDDVTTKKVVLKGSNKTTIITPGDIMKKTLIIAEYMRSARLSSYSRDSDNFMGLKYQTEIKIKIGI